MGYLHTMDLQWQGRFNTLQRQQTEYHNITERRFEKVFENQRRFGGTIEQALFRQDPQAAARRRMHEAHTPAGGDRADTIVPRLGAIDSSARLISRPRSLSELWEEFVHGIGAHKPAKEFTTMEKNNRYDGIKQKYYRRSKIWKIQAYLVNAGYSIHAANARIMRVYPGDGRVTKIVDKIIADGKNTANPRVPALGFRVNPQLVV